MNERLYYDTFILTARDGGKLEFVQSEQLLSDPLTDLWNQIDWEGHIWKGIVIAAGIKIDGEWVTIPRPVAYRAAVTA